MALGMKWVVLGILLLGFCAASSDTSQCYEMSMMPWDPVCHEYVHGGGRCVHKERFRLPCDPLNDVLPPGCIENSTFDATWCPQCFRSDYFLQQVAPWPLGVSIVLWVVDACIWGLFVAEWLSLFVEEEDTPKHPHRRYAWMVFLTILWLFKTVYRTVEIFYHVSEEVDMDVGHWFALLIFPFYSGQVAAVFGAPVPFMAFFSYLALEVVGGGIHIGMTLTLCLVGFGIPFAIVFFVVWKYCNWLDDSDVDLSCLGYCGSGCAVFLFMFPLGAVAFAFFILTVLRVMALIMFCFTGMWPYVFVPFALLIPLCCMGCVLNQREALDDVMDWADEKTGRSNYATFCMSAGLVALLLRLFVVAALMGWNFYISGEYNFEVWGVGEMSTNVRWWLLV